MKASEFKFKVTNKDGVSAIISLNNLTGYDGCWIYGRDVFGVSVPDGLRFVDIDDEDYELDFEYIKGENNEN